MHTPTIWYDFRTIMRDLMQGSVTCVLYALNDDEYDRAEEDTMLLWAQASQ